MEHYFPTGNEFISLPAINENTAGIESISFLYMAQKGMVELRGTDECPLIAPFVRRGTEDVPLTGLEWRREHWWIPVMTARAGDAVLTVTVLAPVGERGFGIRLSLTGADGQTRIGLRGAFGAAMHCVNEDKPIEGTRHLYQSVWNGSFIFDMRSSFPLFAFAPMADREAVCEFAKDASAYSIYTRSGENELTVWWGLGFEEVAAATSAKEMLRRSWEYEYGKTAAWLDARAKTLRTDRLTEIYNTNLFFCIFYSTGITLDTEELICATSRSSRYYVSAAYWDRDTLLWAFPAILDVDTALAKRILEYVFTRQSRSIGVHSRYIDGTVLEPGFELDELAAPVLALSAYMNKTCDTRFRQERFVADSIKHILEILSEMKHPKYDLYETFLQPTDDERVYPYLTYDNMLVWKAMKALAALYPEEYAALDGEAGKLRAAIYENCVFTDTDGKRYFGWSVDLKGHHDVYDEPPGSLQLLPYYGFCGFDDEIWQNTVDMIRSPAYEYSFSGYPIAEIGCPHAPYPWVLSLCNSMLCGYAKQAFCELERIGMDNGIACESVDAVTGECTTGAAFATCAGFLCHAIRCAAEVEE